MISLEDHLTHARQWYTQHIGSCLPEIELSYVPNDIIDDNYSTVLMAVPLLSPEPLSDYMASRLRTHTINYILNTPDLRQHVMTCTPGQLFDAFDRADFLVDSEHLTSCTESQAMKDYFATFTSPTICMFPQLLDDLSDLSYSQLAPFLESRIVHELFHVDQNLHGLFPDFGYSAEAGAYLLQFLHGAMHFGWDGYSDLITSRPSLVTPAEPSFRNTLYHDLITIGLPWLYTLLDVHPSEPISLQTFERFRKVLTPDFCYQLESFVFAEYYSPLVLRELGVDISE